MNLLKFLLAAVVCAGAAQAQDIFAITGTPIPDQLLKLNFGPLPSGIQAYDLNICNLTDARHSLTSSQVFQALAQSQANLEPIGKQIMLAAILRNQNHSFKTWLTLGLNSTTSMLSVLGTGKTTLSPGVLSGIALGALVGEQLMSTWSPVLTADQVEKFEAQTLEPALVMDGGSCVERDVFTAVPVKSKSAVARKSNLEFHIR